MAVSNTFLQLLSLGGGAVEAGLGAYSQSVAASAQGDYQSRMLRVDADWARLEAQDALRRGQDEENVVRRETARLVGAQRAAAGASGGGVNEGTSLELQEDARRLGALDALAVRINAEKEAIGLRSEESQLRSQARLAQLAARGKAGSTLATGGMRVARYLMNAGVVYEDDPYLLESSRPKKKLTVRPPAGKSMSDPRNR